jgi:hypothetical protein
LNRKETEEILKKQFQPQEYQKVYLGGGSGRILFADEDKAKSFQNGVLSLYRRETTEARVAVEIVERDPALDHSLADWIRRGVAMTQQEKHARQEALPLLGGRWLRPCTSCGREPAEKMLSQWGEHRLGRGCRLKRQEVDQLYEVIKPGLKSPQVLKSSATLINRYTEKFIFTTLAQYMEKDGLKVLLPQEFDDIGNCSRPANYMGFIYADGNRMGEVVKKLGQMFPDVDRARLAYLSFSEIVDRATREAAVEAVIEEVNWQDCIIEGEKVRYIPVEFIMAGGDDLMLAVPAQHALEVAIKFIDRFQEKTIQLQKKAIEEGSLPEAFAGCGLTTSAGVVLAHAHYPASDLMTLAGDLMKMAKRLAAELAGNDDKPKQIGTLDFLVFSEAGSEPVKDRRHREYLSQKNLSGRPVHLTERPYATDQARRLLQIIRDLKAWNVPRTKLKALYQVLFFSPLQAQFEGLRLRERLKFTGHLGDPDSPLAALIRDLPHFPFRTGPRGQWTTPWTEIIELYDFIRPKGSRDACEPPLARLMEEDYD